MSRYSLTVAVLASILTSPIYAQTRPTMDIESLEVVPGVLVVVEGVTPQAAADGLSTDALRTEMEQALQRAGVSTLTEREWSDLIGNPALQLTFHLLKPSPHLYLYSATLELRQLTTLVRDSSKGAWTRTWSAGTLLGTTPTGKLASLRGEVHTLVRRFVEAYTEALRRRHGPVDFPDRRRVVVALP
jgi:hypothetical protein